VIEKFDQNPTIYMGLFPAFAKRKSIANIVYYVCNKIAFAISILDRE